MPLYHPDGDPVLGVLHKVGFAVPRAPSQIDGAPLDMWERDMYDALGKELFATAMRAEYEAGRFAYLDDLDPEGYERVRGEILKIRSQAFGEARSETRTQLMLRDRATNTVQRLHGQAVDNAGRIVREQVPGLNARILEQHNARWQRDLRAYEAQRKAGGG